jgi:hypothetical protein
MTRYCHAEFILSIDQNRGEDTILIKPLLRGHRITHCICPRSFVVDMDEKLINERWGLARPASAAVFDGNRLRDSGRKSRSLFPTSLRSLRARATPGGGRETSLAGCNRRFEARGSRLFLRPTPIFSTSPLTTYYSPFFIHLTTHSTLFCLRPTTHDLLQGRLYRREPVIPTG